MTPELDITTKTDRELLLLAVQKLNDLCEDKIPTLSKRVSWLDTHFHEHELLLVGHAERLKNLENRIIVSATANGKPAQVEIMDGTVVTVTMSRKKLLAWIAGLIVIGASIASGVQSLGDYLNLWNKVG
jgi:hypothetical protein